MVVVPFFRLGSPDGGCPMTAIDHNTFTNNQAYLIGGESWINTGTSLSALCVSSVTKQALPHLCPHPSLPGTVLDGEAVMTCRP